LDLSEGKEDKNMVGCFLKEEKGQGAIEYILLAGGIIVAAVVIFAIYSRMTRSMGEAANQSATQASEGVSSGVNNEIAAL